VDEDMLGIDPDLCDGCDLCVPACPQGAIERRFAPTVKRSEDIVAAFLRCEYSDVVGIREGLMPCLYALGTIDLLELSRRGVEYLITSSGDCDACPRGFAVRLEQRVVQVNVLLSAREMNPLQYRKLNASQWGQACRRMSDADGNQPLSRRAFFRKAARVPGEKLDQALTEDSSRYVPPGALLPRNSGNAPLPFVLDIDTSRCTGCDACVRLCPHQVIRLDGAGDSPTAYRIEPEKCSGCGLCQDVCEQNAVKIFRWSVASKDRVPLRTGKCSACGVAFHVPEVNQPRSPLCRICSHTDHYKNLYQVLD
jgi:ferredoxin